MPRFWLPFLLAFTLCGCASTRSFVSGTIADTIPEWAGGLPPDAPPRPATPGYEKFEKDLNAKLAAPKNVKSAQDKPAGEHFLPSIGPKEAFITGLLTHLSTHCHRACSGPECGLLRRG
jgi:hypothetical protein